MTIVTVMVGALLCASLLTESWPTPRFATAPCTETATPGLEALRSATRLAILAQRSTGPSACTTISLAVTVNDVTATTTCTQGAVVESGEQRLGVVTTSMEPTRAHLRGAVGPSTMPISGDVMLSGGTLSTDDTAGLSLAGSLWLAQGDERFSLLDANGTATPTDCAYADLSTIAMSDRYSSPPGEPHTTTCQGDQWTAFAGTATADGRQYPLLPPAPTRQRNEPFVDPELGDCQVFLPGRYSGSPLTLDHGRYFFASGVYLFDVPLIVANGAEVVFGDPGPIATATPPCASDASAARVAARHHVDDGIEGSGAILILGGRADLRISGDDTTVEFGARRAGANDPSTSGISIRSVTGSAIATPTLDVPADRVQLGDGSTTDTSGYSPTSAGETSPLVHVSVGDHSRVSIPGLVMVPQAQVVVDGSANDYTVDVSGGVVASDVVVAAQGNPSSWRFGYVPKATSATFDLVSTVPSGSRSFVSSARIQVTDSGDYAVNSWSIDA